MQSLCACLCIRDAYQKIDPPYSLNVKLLNLEICVENVKLTFYILHIINIENAPTAHNERENDEKLVLKKSALRIFSSSLGFLLFLNVRQKFVRIDLMSHCSCYSSSFQFEQTIFLRRSFFPYFYGTYSVAIIVITKIVAGL